MSRRSRMLACFAATAFFAPAYAQDAGEEVRVLAVADSALAAITRGDFVGLTDLMLDEAVAFPSTSRGGELRYSVRTRAEQRASKRTGIVERGYRPQVHVQGPIAVVWYPYDLYIDGKWSHCGVDVFTMLKPAGRWRITTIVWSAEQPPVCEKHPDGPPRG